MPPPIRIPKIPKDVENADPPVISPFKPNTILFLKTCPEPDEALIPKIPYVPVLLLIIGPTVFNSIVYESPETDVASSTEIPRIVVVKKDSKLRTMFLEIVPDPPDAPIP